MKWYYSFLVRRPYLMVLSVGVLCTACIIVSLITKTFPDFSDPTLGFEARGTEIGQRLTAWRNLWQETGPSGKLVANPNDLLSFQQDYNQDVEQLMGHHKKRQRKKKKKNKKKTNADLSRKIKKLRKFSNSETDADPTEWNGDTGVFRDYAITNDSITDEENHHRNIYGRNISFVDEKEEQERVQSKKSTWRILSQSTPPPMFNEVHINIDGFFCESPTKEFSHFVVERIGPNSTDSLFDVNALLAMCQLEHQIIAIENYGDYCQKEMLTDNCCRPWSIPNYVAMLSNKTSCFDLTPDDVAAVQSLLVGCYDYYLNMKIGYDCSESRCPAPIECTRHNAVFNILHYLTDLNFIKINDSNLFLKYSMIFVPVAQTTKILSLFHHWENTELKNELVQVTAMDLGLKNTLFDESLLADGWLVGLGGLSVMICMWLYTSSLFVTGMTCIAVIFSLGLAYFIYTLIFEMTFFPFMNLLAVVVIIGIGADDAFIFLKLWQCILAERITKSSSTNSHSISVMDTEYSETLQYLMATTLSHSALSMFVTSLTTAAAFYASYLCSITSIKCFGIFAGTAVMSNFFLMVTWLPATVSIMERISCDCGKCISHRIFQKFNKSINCFCKKLEDLTVNAVLKFPIVWVILFSTIGIGSGIVVLYYPGIQLPETSDFQLFVNSHPFELYDSKFKNEFSFERMIPSLDKLPMRFVWGILPIDDGDYANPSSHGNLHFDNNFNISSKASQLWLFNFCKNIKQQPFYKLTLGMLLPNCFIESFISYMSRICIDSIDLTDRTPCCDTSKFPYEPDVFEYCLPHITHSLYSRPKIFIPGVAGPKFMAAPENYEDENSTQIPPIVKAIVIEFESNVSYTMAYPTIKEFVHSVEAWFETELKTAPPQMQGGWFVSELSFYDLQDTLSKGTINAILMSMIASLVVLLFVTLNVLISFYAVITVTFTIFTTVAILILLGWKLNILESVSVSTAIGLAVDFSIHYGIHYRMSPTNERDAATRYALTRICGPTAMAALTTALAGAFLLGSELLPYIQIGVFLVVCVTVSWFYATFFLISVLKLIGPQYGFMQLKFPKFKKRPKKTGGGYYERKPSQAIASEQLLTPSSSAVGDLLNSETHELDSLTSNSLIKPMSECSRPPIDLDRAFIRTASTVSNNCKDYQSPSTGSAITMVLSEDPNYRV
ncbi:protein dispatched isoform X1 [Eupeodes corollae]|uniref:protein dispatched isoform X1 n=1 Tax=Eupeodes corollae TaxID=290404 RepID=UPI002492050D|nr:protein dispatched isoform X1 [Eupeodes corollae]